MVSQVKQWYEDYDTYWMAHLKYLDTPTVKNFLQPGGLLDSWVGIITDMSDRLDKVTEERRGLDVTYNMDFHQDIPRFVGKPKQRIGRKS